MAGQQYILFNKPYGVLSTFTDPEGRPTLKNYVDVADIYAAGRLDFDSEGLMLLTDDGDLIHWLTEPRYHLPKTYWVMVEGEVTDSLLDPMRKGLDIKGYRTRPAQVETMPDPDLPPRSKPVTPHGPTQWLKITISEGKKRQIRHMTAAVGLPTLRLVRYAIGPLTLDGLNLGQWRRISPEELAHLRVLQSSRPARRR